jgi:hypothetical protein
METAILHEKIDRFMQSSESRFTKDLANDFREWVRSTEIHLSEQELESFEVSTLYQDREQFIDLLFKLLVITGNSDKLMQMQIMDRDKFHAGVDFLFKQKDRLNHHNLYSICTLLELAKAEGKQISNLRELKRYADHDV